MIAEANPIFVGNDRWEYLPGRWIEHGERVRVTGGPVWIDADGVRHAMGERGVFKFDLLAVDGTGKPFVLVCGVDGYGTIALPVGKRKSKLGLAGWKSREYRFAKVRGGNSSSKRKVRT